MEQVKDFIGVLMVKIMKMHRNQVENKLCELGLHAGQDMILFRLWDNDGMTQSQLCDCLNLEPPTVTKMLQRMEATGLVERRPDHEDARVSRVFVTKAGHAVQEDTVRIWYQMEKRLLEGISETEQLLLRRLLLQMKSNLQAKDDVKESQG